MESLTTPASMTSPIPKFQTHSKMSASPLPPPVPTTEVA